VASGITKKETSPMQTLFDAASHIAQEIERTRQHLINLEQALQGLKPLITVDAQTTALTFSMSAQAQQVEDLSVVNAEEPAKKKSKSKSKSSIMAKAVTPKGDKLKVTKSKVVKPTPVPVVESIKLPATGAELWLKCLGRKKATVAQLADAALKRLKLDESAKNVMATRAKAWVYIATKKGTLVVVGDRDGAKLYQLAPLNEGGAEQNVAAAEPAVSAEDALGVEVVSAT
jgi:hypothetical protein